MIYNGRLVDEIGHPIIRLRSTCTSLAAEEVAKQLLPCMLERPTILATAYPTYTSFLHHKTTASALLPFLVPGANPQMNPVHINES